MTASHSPTPASGARTVTKMALIAVAALAAALVLTGCSTPRDISASQAPGEVVHKEYVPASMKTVESCSGAVPMVCGSEQVLEKQCWRVDVKAQWKEGDSPMRMIVGHCVFPSEFEQIRLGDTWAPGEVVFDQRLYYGNEWRDDSSPAR